MHTHPNRFGLPPRLSAASKLAHAIQTRLAAAAPADAMVFLFALGIVLGMLIRSGV